MAGTLMWVEPKDEELEKRKKKVRGDSSAYFNFIAGEESLETERSPYEDTVKYAWDQFLMYTGLYQYQFATEFNSGASKALLSICNDMRVKSHHISDLLQRGADPNYCDGSRYNETPIFGAIRSSNFRAVEILILAGAKTTHLDNICRTPLMMACDTQQYGDRIRIINRLLQQRDVIKLIELRDSGGNSALLNAVFNNNVWAVRELLLAGASVLDAGTGAAAGVAISSAYETAKWIYSVGIGIDPSDTALPKSLEHPSSFLYKHFSFKARYDLASLLYFQSCWKYSAELVFRMICRKKIEEERMTKALRQSHVYVKAVPDELLADLLTEEEMDREQALNSRRFKKMMKIKKLREVQTKKEQERWQRSRLALAAKIDSQYTENIKGKKESSLVEWVKQTSDTGTAVEQSRAKSSRKQRRSRDRKERSAIDEADEGDEEEMATQKRAASEVSSFPFANSLPVASSPSPTSPSHGWKSVPKSQGIYSQVPIAIPPTKVITTAIPTEDETKGEVEEFNEAIRALEMRRARLGADDQHASSNTDSKTKEWKSAIRPHPTPAVLTGVWTPAFSLNENTFSTPKPHSPSAKAAPSPARGNVLSKSHSSMTVPAEVPESN